MRAVLDSFECELPDNGLAIHVSMGLLDFPRRRNAFLLAAVMAGADHYRSRAFVEKFARVNRKTLGLWKRDPVIWDQLLGWEPRWAEAAEAWGWLMAVTVGESAGIHDAAVWAGRAGWPWKNTGCRRLCCRRRRR